ncbi:MAG: DNA polymerase III subunit gamma/tau [Planctomycetaceae bacterium]|nr:MAG: DNA polymerase III subunit gamma/tau [Planctomycetaceae bacterium]
MEYTVLARRFRPQAFGEVVGQEAIAQALRNAISGGRVAHAYLFTGARGVGKTSTARILAKSLNCPQANGGDPCNQCEICQGISEGADVDVLEIDGASNRGIDEIRTLRSNVNIKPMRSRYKIYIIDEVHMLTKEAFNALLKTLEEPPPNVKFIFCTTDPQKLPETILSRCQRFDFGTIETSRIRQRLAEIATAEGVVVEPSAIDLVARRANGSMRDSQSLFDQLLAFGGAKVTTEEVHRLLGTAPDSRLIDMARVLVGRDCAAVLAQLDLAVSSGAQLGEFVDQLIACFRDLMVLAAGATNAPLMSVGEDLRPDLVELAKVCGLQSSMAGLQMLADAKQRMKGVTYGRILAELALVRIASLEQLDAIAETVAWLRAGRLASAAPGGSSGVGAALPGRSRAIYPPPESGSGSGGAAQEKKSDLSSAGGGQEPDAGPRPTIALEPGNESEIMAQVMMLLPDMMRSHVRGASRTAISGPNQLVLTLPKRYHLSKTYFERSPEQLARLQGAVEQVVGCPVRVHIELDATPEETTETASKSVDREAVRRTPAAEPDVFVQRALAAFGATIVRVDRVETTIESATTD